LEDFVQHSCSADSGHSLSDAFTKSNVDKKKSYSKSITPPFILVLRFQYLRLRNTKGKMCGKNEWEEICREAAVS